MIGPQGISRCESVDVDIILNLESISNGRVEGIKLFADEAVFVTVKGGTAKWAARYRWILGAWTLLA